MDTNQLKNDIQRFLDVYNFLTPEAGAMFEAQLAPHLKKTDARTRNLYNALLSSAKDNLGIEDAITRMEESSLKAQNKLSRPE